MIFERINPRTGKVVSKSHAMQVSDIPPICEMANAGYLAWSAIGPNLRRNMLMAAIDGLETRREDFIEAMESELGTSKEWAMHNLRLGASILREAAALTTQIGGETIPADRTGCLTITLREPVGVVLGIAHWSAPIIFGIRAIATPLACGNAVIFKASEICPRTHQLIMNACADAGFPPGTVTQVTHAPASAGEVVGALIDNPTVKRINFTGSSEVGRIIAERAARNLKSCILELGSKASMLVLEDADLDEAVKAAAFGAYINRGQICMSTERLIVVESVADEFAAKLTVKTDQIPINDYMGAMVDLEAVEYVNALILDAEAQGATILVGGCDDSVHMPATLLDHTNPKMRIYSEESFGPVAAIIRVRDEAHAIAVANDTEYGLSSSIFTRDIARGLRVARQIRSGMCHVNGPTIHDEPHMPFGGVDHAGYGRFGGKAGIDSFTELRRITVATEPGKYSFENPGF
ncbi:MAG: aldehyde dehydrogenase [Gammaproteobacteria bacterium]|nr:aldehyde dehydrogenase [Gammaproteobacteria bacterium]